jgi:hypothetical protein
VNDFSLPSFIAGVHPACEAFPLLPPDELEALADNIRASGLRDPITVTPDFLLLDGKNRCAACAMAGVIPTYTVYSGDPVEYVVSRNLARRHMDESQRAMIAARLANLKVGDNQHAGGSANLPTLISQTAAAEKLKVSVSSVGHARAVLNSGDRKLIAAVDNREIRVSAAAKQARHKARLRVVAAPARKPEPPGEDVRKELAAARAEIVDARAEIADLQALVRLKDSQIALLLDLHRDSRDAYAEFTDRQKKPN